MILNSIKTKKEIRVQFRPFFSVLIATYNRPTYIGKCLKSIFENKFSDFEVIISDDHSQKVDEIKAEIQPYLKFPNVNFIYQPQNLGFHENYNYLIDKANGKFLILVDDDDKLRSNTLSELKKYIDKFPNYDLYGFGYEVIDEEGRFCCSYCPPKSFEISLQHPEFIRNLFFSDVLPFWVFHSCALAFKKEIGNKIRRKKEASIGADLVFLFESINSGKKMFVIPEVLFSYRKMLGKDQDEYFNWTGPSITNIIARRNILYNILYQSNLNQNISKLILSDSYLKRYLLDPLIFNKLVQEESLNKLNLKEDHLKKLIEFFRPKIYFIHRLRIRFEQLTDYIKLFGPKGLFHIFLPFIQRFCYKLKRN